MSSLHEQVLFSDERFPLVLEPGSGDRNLARAVELHEGRLDAKLLEHGALLFRGFDVRDVTGFDAFIDAISEHRASYVYRSTPRTSVGDGIYTATEYPPELEIPLHNENAYQRSWPRKLAFCCLTPAASGGETPLADMRRVSAAIGTSLLDEFESRGVRYVRHYRPYVDIPWETVFQTSDRDALARYCAASDIAHEWLDDDTLRTVQVCQGTARHPVTGDRVFFNQAHLFHVSSLGPEKAQFMRDVFGADRLPRHACYGDGGEIGAAELDTVAAAFRSAAISFPWQAGDVLLLDNMQVAHGRRPFTGERKVVASLLDPYSEPAPARLERL